MLITGDMNFPNILWDSSSRARGANEVAFVDALNDHYLTQVNGVATRDGNVLDLIITSMLDQVTVTEVLSPEQSGVFTDPAYCPLSILLLSNHLIRLIELCMIMRMETLRACELLLMQ